jgi:hypothetical protein
MGNMGVGIAGIVGTIGVAGMAAGIIIADKRVLLTV